MIIMSYLLNVLYVNVLLCLYGFHLVPPYVPTIKPPLDVKYSTPGNYFCGVVKVQRQRSRQLDHQMFTCRSVKNPNANRQRFIH